jgi:hypothetical protein
MKRKAKRPGAPAGHPGWGGRPRGVEMPCGWGCGAHLSAGEIRDHFKNCPKRPQPSRIRDVTKQHAGTAFQFIGGVRKPKGE